MTSANQLLSYYEITMQEAREFINANIASPQNIYSAAAQYGITFDMLAEIYGQGATGEVVKEFFGNQGFVNSGDAPHWNGGYLEGDFSSMYQANQSELMQKWGDLLNNYRAKMAGLDWGSQGTSFAEVEKEVNWYSFAEVLEGYEAAYGENSEWMTYVNQWLDNLINLDAWDDLDGEEYEESWSTLLPLEEWGVDEATFISVLNLDENDLEFALDTPDVNWESYYGKLLESLMDVETGYGAPQPEQVIAEPIAALDIQLVGITVQPDEMVL